MVDRCVQCGEVGPGCVQFHDVVPTAVHGQIDLGGARNLNERDPPENLIRSGCARVLVDDLINEVEFLRDVVTHVFDDVGVALAEVEGSYPEDSPHRKVARHSLRAIAKLRQKWIKGATL